MATDATGTPTPLGIPKYDTQNDAPSGLGFNATMDAIDAILTQAPRSGAIAGIAIGSVPVWNGTAWVKPTGTPDGTKFLRDDGAWATPSGGPGYGTALPGSPSDGQEYILVDSLTAPTYQWRFRYNNGATTNKWEFIGGAPKVITAASGESTTSNSYVDLTTVQSFTVPVTGIYLARAVVGVVNSVANPGRPRHAILFNAVTVAEGEGLTGNSTGPIGSCEHSASISATQVIKQVFKTSTADSMTFGARVLSILPLRIGG